MPSLETRRRHAAAAGLALLILSGIVCYLNAPGANGLPRSPRVHRLIKRYKEMVERDRLAISGPTP